MLRNAGDDTRESRPDSALFTVIPAMILRLTVWFTVGVGLATASYAQTRDLVVAEVSANNRATLAGHHPAWAITQNDLGPVPADLPFQHLEIVLGRPSEVQQAFEQFLAAQQDPTSPNYHQWLTPAQIGARFGASDHDIAAITGWLQSQNITVDSVSASRMRIAFSGPALAMGNAFGADLHYFNVDAERRISIADDPQIPSALTGIITAVTGLYEVKLTSYHRATLVQMPAPNSASTPAGDDNEVPLFNGASGSHFIVPADFAKIYDLPGGTVTGAGQTIAIIGRARVNPADITNFQMRTGLTQQAPTVIIPPTGTDPGAPQTAPPTSGSVSGDQGEATLDVTRTSSIAVGATIDLVVSADTQTASGLGIASEYVVEPTPNPIFAHVMTISFGACEGAAGSAGVAFWNNLFMQAAGEGISVFVSSGDSGAAGCDVAFSPPPVAQSLSTNYICSSSYATCVGGTEFNDTGSPATYWAASNTMGTLGSALGYIPESGWNEPSDNGQPQASSSGGGFSLYVPTPAWQTGTGVPGTQGRYTPDVAFSASGHDGYFGCFAAAGASCVSTNGMFEYFYGTSAAAPDMAGIVALLDQKFGAPQGNLNPNLYRLAATTSNNVFHDVTVATSGVTGCVVTIPSMCNNSTPGPTSQTGGLSGYLVQTGYDEVTGLGSIDVGNLLASWIGASTTMTSTPNPSTIGAAVTFTVTVSGSGGPTPTGSVTFFNSGVSIGAGTLNTSGVATFSTSALPVGSSSITAQYSGDQNYASGVSNALTQVVTLLSSTTTLTSSLNPSIGGQAVTFTATVTGTGSTPTGTVTFLDGSTALSTVSLSAGVATFSDSMLSTGSHSIAASYSGDTKFSASTSSSLGQTVSVVAFGPAPTGLTVAAGNTLMIPITLIQATGSTLSFQLSCTGLPTKSTCSSSAIVPGPPPTGTVVQLAFGTASSSVPAHPQGQERRPWTGIGIATLLAAVLASISVTFTSLPRKRSAYGLCFATVILAIAMAGCGSSSTPAPYTGTPKGATTFTVTATSGNTTATTSVTITVQ